MTENTTPAVTISPAATDKAATQFAKSWERTPARLYAAAKAADTLRNGGMSQADTVEALKAAIARDYAASMGRGDDAPMIADMVQSVKLSASAVSQLTSALARARQSKADNADTVSAFYRAATGYVPAKALKAIAAEAEQLNTGHAEFVAERISTALADAGAERRAKRSDKADKASADKASADSVEQTLSVTKNGAAAFTLAEILRAAESLAAEAPNDKAAKAVRNVAQRIVEVLAA